MAGLWDAIQGAGAAAGGLAYAGLISDRGQQYANQMGTLAGELQADAGFKGYGVKTGLGSTTVAADGSIDSTGVGPNAAMGAGAGNYTAGNTAMANALMGLGRTAANPYEGTARGYMGQANQGLGGMQGSAFGASRHAMGQANLGLGSMQGSALGASQQAMGNAMMDTAAREQEIYNRAMAMQQPQLDAQRASGNAAEYASGRGGVMGSQFGGSGEDAAMARAQAQAQNQASFQAMGQAQQEMMNQANMASQFGQMGLGAAGQQASQASQFGQLGLGAAGQQANQASALNQMGIGNAQLAQQAAMQQGQLGGQMAQLGMNAYSQSFLPMEQQLAWMGAGNQTASMAQTGQLTGTGYAAQLGLGGIQTAVNADKAASEMYGNIIGSMMNNANTSDGESSWLGGLFGDGGLFG